MSAKTKLSEILDKTTVAVVVAGTLAIGGLVFSIATGESTLVKDLALLATGFLFGARVITK